MTRFTPLATLVALLLALTSAGAQTAPPAHISVVDGAATVSRTSGSEMAVPDLPLDPGDRVRTGDGHVEIVTGDGSVLHLDAQTTVDVNAMGVVRLLGGRLVVSATQAGDSVQVDAVPASVRLSLGSEGRLSLFQDTDGVYLDVAMIRGDASVTTAMSATSVFAGSRVIVRSGQAPSEEMAFNSAESDPFFDWSNSLLDERRGTTSAQYLPSDLGSYSASFDQGGSWSYLAPYGYVWYPTVVAGWHPYYQGRWCRRDDGWNFVGDGGRWNYPTHHYGRWGVGSNGGWFWVPGRQWSSAWVQWAAAPGYVSWSPLGTNDKPVGTWASRTDMRTGAPGRGWTVVRSTTFADGANVSKQAIDVRALARTPTPAFVQQTTPPQVAVSRGHFGVAGPAVPAQVRAVPRASAAVPTRAARVMTPPAPSVPPVVYYRGGSVTTGNAADVHPGHAHARDAAASRGMTVGGVQPPPIPYRNGPPIIAAPRAVPPGGAHTGPPIMAGPPPVIGAPPAFGSAAGARAGGGAITRPAPPAHAAPAPPPPPAPAPTAAPPAHAVASPRSGSPR
jgi:hypothetical protein